MFVPGALLLGLDGAQPHPARQDGESNHQFSACPGATRGRSGRLCGMPNGPPTVLSGVTLPHQLRDLPRPPEEAYLWGRLPPGPRVGIVGTRESSTRGFRIAFEVARQLASLGMTIVSGGAKGIDRAAHLGALRARAPTLVVAPAWLHRATPGMNVRLFDLAVERGGGYLTVASPTDSLIEPTYWRRNEILVALCDVVLFGEMGVPSGALSAARYARNLGVPRFILPWHPGAPDLRGTQAELERGAIPYYRSGQLVSLLSARTFDNPDYWERSPAALVGPPRKRKRRRKKAAAASSCEVVATSFRAIDGDPVLDAIARGATTVDLLVEATGLSAAAAQHRVLGLTLEGAVYRDQGGLLQVVDENR
jgi:DNA processing protein